VGWGLGLGGGWLLGGCLGGCVFGGVVCLWICCGVLWGWVLIVVFVVGGLGWVCVLVLLVGGVVFVLGVGWGGGWGLLGVLCCVWGLCGCVWWGLGVNFGKVGWEGGDVSDELGNQVVVEVYISGGVYGCVRLLGLDIEGGGRVCRFVVGVGRWV
jgi:hypothetical protein